MLLHSLCVADLITLTARQTKVKKQQQKNSNMSHISSLLSHSVAPKSEYVKNYKNVSVTRPFHASPNQTDMIAPLSPISHILETNLTFVVHTCI